ncbi:MAG TPA: CGNR zinc finger domain-containing protein, partial [Actinomycetota bacterium]|nr:CGNR zinc finger domain-containing protein [Actinomycetota bacterium]
VTKGMSDGTWSRMKACKRDRCRWLFYDHSRNRSAVWCLMEVCGNKEKAAAYRRRKRSTARG